MEYAYGHYYNPAQPGNSFCDECRPIGQKVLKRSGKFAKHHAVCVVLTIISIALALIFVYAFGFGWTHPGVWHFFFTMICALSALFKRGWIYDIVQRHGAEQLLAQIPDPENQFMEEVELMNQQEHAEPPHEGRESDPEEIPGNLFEGQEQHVAGCPGLQQGGNTIVVVNAEVHYSHSYSPSNGSKESSRAASPSTCAATHDSGLSSALSQQQSSASTSNAATNCLAEEEEST